MKKERQQLSKCSLVLKDPTMQAEFVKYIRKEVQSQMSVVLVVFFLMGVLCLAGNRFVK